jgi:hypothetical protein
MRDCLPEGPSFEELLRGNEQYWGQYRNLTGDHRRLLRAVKDGLGLRSRPRDCREIKRESSNCQWSGSAAGLRGVGFGHRSRQ